MKNLVVIIIIVLLSAFGIFMYMSSAVVPASTDQGSLVAGGFLGDNGTTFSGREFLKSLVNIQSIKLNDAIFKDAVFSSLRDFSKTLTPQEKGRVNPFLPIGVE